MNHMDPGDELIRGKHVIAYSDTLHRYEYGVVKGELSISNRRYRRVREFTINFQGRETFVNENVQLFKNRRLQIKTATADEIEYAANASAEISAIQLRERVESETHAASSGQAERIVSRTEYGSASPRNDPGPTAATTTPTTQVRQVSILLNASATTFPAGTCRWCGSTKHKTWRASACAQHTAYKIAHPDHRLYMQRPANAPNPDMVASVAPTVAPSQVPRDGPVLAPRRKRAKFTRLPIRRDVAGVRPAFHYLRRVKDPSRGLQALSIAIRRQRLENVRVLQARLHGTVLHGPTAGRIRGRCVAIARLVCQIFGGPGSQGEGCAVTELAARIRDYCWVRAGCHTACLRFACANLLGIL
jgi:hypothetical protein